MICLWSFSFPSDYHYDYNHKWKFSHFQTKITLRWSTTRGYWWGFQTESCFKYNILASGWTLRRIVWKLARCYLFIFFPLWFFNLISNHLSHWVFTFSYDSSSTLYPCEKVGKSVVVSTSVALRLASLFSSTF